MAERKGGLGRGLAALIPSAPSDIDNNGKTPGIGGNASDVIFGKEAPKPDDAPKGAPRKVKGAPTVSAKRDKVIQPVPVGARYQEIPIGQIIPNPKQPRQVFDEDELAELVHSIREFGLLQPIVVRDTKEGFELIMGERRWRAARGTRVALVPVGYADGYARVLAGRAEVLVGGRRVPVVGTRSAPTPSTGTRRSCRCRRLPRLG